MPAENRIYTAAAERLPPQTNTAKGKTPELKTRQDLTAFLCKYINNKCLRDSVAHLAGCVQNLHGNNLIVNVCLMAIG